MSQQDPWADPSTETQPGAPYAGPPTTVPPGPGSPYGHYGAPYGWPPAPYGSPYGPYAWTPAPVAPRRPGQVIAAAVLAFVQAGVVALSSVYLFFIASIVGTVEAAAPDADPSELHRLSVEGTALAAVQLVTIVALVAAGILAFNRRHPSSWWLMIAALGSQVVLAVYWAVRLGMLSGQLSDSSGSSPASAFAVMALFFAAGPVVGIVLLLVGPARRWFAPA